jgi:hypothetical protein
MIEMTKKRLVHHPYHAVWTMSISTRLTCDGESEPETGVSVTVVVVAVELPAMFETLPVATTVEVALNIVTYIVYLLVLAVRAVCQFTVIELTTGAAPEAWLTVHVALVIVHALPTGQFTVTWPVPPICITLALDSVMLAAYAAETMRTAAPITRANESVFDAFMFYLLSGVCLLQQSYAFLTFLHNSAVSMS